MANKVFVDTNILIDLFDSSRQHHLSAIQLFDALEHNVVRGFVTESVLNTTAYLLRKEFSTTRIKEIFNHLLLFVNLVPVTNKIYQNALLVVANDIEDAVLYTAALEAKIHFFVTSNTKDFKKIEQKQLPIISSHEFIKKCL